MYEIQVAAKTANLDDVIAFLDDIMEQHDVPMKIRVQVDVAAEEVFVNIAHYGYPTESGTAKITVDITDEGLTIRFVDSGTPYDPLQKQDPDVTLSAEERPIGGLGIFMVKKSMDDVSYVYENGCNILTLFKKIPAN